MMHRRGFLSSGAAAIGAGAYAMGSASAQEDSEDTSSIGKTPHTKFAVNIEMWFTGIDFLDRIRETAKLGFPAIEFWPYAGRDLKAIADLTGELGIEIAQFTAWGFEPGMNHPKNEAAFLKTIDEACEVAHQLRCRKMTVVAGNIQLDRTQQEMLAQVTRCLELAAPTLESANVMAILEPMNGRVDHPGHCLYGSTDALAICRQVDSPMVKINWDLYHMQITEGDLCGHLRDGIDQVGYLQLADHPGRFEPGTGEVHYNRVLKEAFDLGYQDFVGLECRPKEGELQAARRVAAADVW